MSSISSIGGGNGLYQFLQNVSASTASGATSATTATNPSTTSSATDSGQAIQGHHHHHGHGGGNKSQAFQQIQQAVTSALQSAQPGTDPNQTIQDAIAKVFQNNNSAASTGGQASANTPATATDPDGDTATTGANAGSGKSTLQAFFQTLQSLGVDPQQFHQDFLGAVQNAQNGNVDANSAFQSFPPGSLIDTTG